MARTGTIALCLWAELFGKLNASKYSWCQFNIASKDGKQWLIYLRNTTDIAKVKTNLVLIHLLSEKYVTLMLMQCNKKEICDSFPYS